MVEDDDLVRRVLERTLQRNGYQIVAVESAAKAREVWASRQGRFSLVISDVVMPGENGLLLCQALRDLRPELPVLLITGFTPADIVEDAGTISFPVLAKPFTGSQLLNTVRDLLV